MKRRRATPSDAELARTPGLFERSAPPTPLADRLRPQTLADLYGQEQLLEATGFLRHAIEHDRVPSLILWGPPGSGKTSLAQIIAKATQNEFIRLSAVSSGVAEVRTTVADAVQRRAREGRGTILFLDEIHRFNRAQQDALLPHVENGTLVLIGATSENPSFNVNAAILSRCKVLRLDALAPAVLHQVLTRALASDRGYRGTITSEDAALELIAHAADGDARRALNLLEAAVSLALADTAASDPAQRADSPSDQTRPVILRASHVERAQSADTLLYDRQGEEHYNVTSALIKSLRGSDPDAAIYWLMRMVDAGDDPLFISRRLLIFASEDVGNADPRALAIAVDADRALQRLGMPEGLYPLAHCCLYLASCPKSNSVGTAFGLARRAIEQQGALAVPKKLRNAVTPLMQQAGYGEGYHYAHDFTDHFVPGESYLPEQLAGARFYTPSDQGFEQNIGERLRRLREANKAKS